MQVKYGGKKYFWGNVPAVDIVSLAANEGLHYEEDISILLAGKFRQKPRIAAADKDQQLRAIFETL